MVAASACGACTLCCTLMRVVELDPPKPEHTPCAHCDGRGCAIYDRRPDQCQGFSCMWLGSQRVPALRLPAAMRPDRCGVVIDLNEAGTVIAHCARRESWKREPMRSWLLHHARRTTVILEPPGRAEILNADGSTDPLVKVGVDPTSNNRVYVREAQLDEYLRSVAA